MEKLIQRTRHAEKFALQREFSRIRRGLGKEKDDPELSKELSRLTVQAHRSVEKRASRQKNRPRPAYDETLPITAKKEEIIEAIRNHSVVVISGETGSGKTTQIPKFCLDAGRGIEGKIGCTQPRRIAAITVAERIAEELGEAPGRSAGYKIRFTDQTSHDGFIKIMTDGILLAEAQGDRFLNEYDTIIVDEAHERSLNIDFVLGILKTLLKRRKNLKLIITSATIDTEKFSKAFDDAPVIEVSGRMFPVEVRYAPPDPENGDEQSHVDTAAAAVDKICAESPYGGDILVFMPTEHDIRETCEILEGRDLRGTTILPLFARLSAQEQSRIFAKTRGRKIVVATNVAETSITIPGIRYVVDTGLARISRYSPRTRTTALPVTPIAKSSADQRLGRCGRVQNGICVRLFSEEDYEARPRFTPPEILRANLAEVILRMISLRLGDPADFPFVDPPSPKHIQDGFNLLLELGAIESDRSGAEEQSSEGKPRYLLTDQGRLMARIPLDPRLSRLLLQAGEDGCLEEMMVIAAALSIQDPRERPSEKEEQADRAQKPFLDDRSDFITLLNIWNSAQEALKESMGSLRRFCKTHFISFRRIREWRDVQSQIRSILEENGYKTPKPGAVDFLPERYDPIHRSVLSGFLSNIALKKEKYIYTAARNREAMIFPGSGLFSNPPPWIVAAEMVETSRLFARTAARIDPAWIEPLARNQCRYTYLDPHWERNRGEVTAKEQVSLYGLIIEPGRPVSYGRIDPDEANDIFIDSALITGDVRKPFPFMTHNRKLIQEIREMEDRVRRRDLLVGETEMYRFYKERLPDVYDIRTLGGILKKKKDRFLRMRRDDLLLNPPDQDQLELYPKEISIGNTALPGDYRFEPGAANDGLTVRVHADMAGDIPLQSLEWLVPGLLKEKITALIKGLPKEHRKRLVPVTETVDTILSEMPREPEQSLATALSRFIHRRFNLSIPASEWPLADLPDHLKMRISVIDPAGKELRAGRDPAILLQKSPETARSDDLEETRRSWEKKGLTGWDFGDLPDAVELKGKKGKTMTLYPGLKPSETENGADLTLFPTRQEAAASHREGVAALYEHHLSKNLKFLKKRLSLPKSAEKDARYFGGTVAVSEQLYRAVIRDLFTADIRTEKGFYRHGENAAGEMVEKGDERQDLALRVIKAYSEARGAIYDLEIGNRSNPKTLSFLKELRESLVRLVPENFIDLYGPERLSHMERYIRAIAIRAQRGLYSMDKDAAKADDVLKHVQQLDRLIRELSPTVSDQKRAAIEEFFWMIEEYKVSLFAQELKTPFPVSAKRLSKKRQEIEMMI